MSLHDASSKRPQRESISFSHELFESKRGKTHIVRPVCETITKRVTGEGSREL